MYGQETQAGPVWIWSLLCQVTAHWEKFMATERPEEEADKSQADFVRSAVRDVHYGPESLSEFTQWRVCHWRGDAVLGVGGFPGCDGLGDSGVRGEAKGTETAQLKAWPHPGADDRRETGGLRWGRGPGSG